MDREDAGGNRVRNRTLALVLLGFAIALLAFAGDRAVLAQEEPWTEPVVISAPPGFSWFPDLAVDELGSLHVVWCQTIPLEKRRGLQEQVSYAVWNGENWSEPNDIVPPSPDIVRNAIDTDLAGNVHLLFGGSVYDDGLALYHRRARIGEARSAMAWSTPHRINQGTSYMGDMAVDSGGVIHVVYDDTIRYSDEDELAVADIFYRRSADGGRTWSAPVSLNPTLPVSTTGPYTPTGSARSYMEIDSQDVIHVTWDEGWDRLTGEGDPEFAFYTASSDGGETWMPVTRIEYPESTVAQLTVGSDGQGGVMLVWRTTSRNELFYQWSTDSGQSWTEPSAVWSLFARPWTNPFDMYDMATDSAGNIHLLAVGRQSQDVSALLGVYHLVWDGERWSAPTRLFAQPGLYPEYPKIFVHEGNQIHTVWFTREESVWEQDVARQVWYSSSRSAAPHQPVTPLPTSTPVPLTPTPSPVPTATPYPTVSFENTGLPDGLHTDNDDVYRLVLALSPVAVAILVVMAVRMRWFGRSRR